MPVPIVRSSALCALAVSLAAVVPASSQASSTTSIRATATAKSGINVLRAGAGARPLRSSVRLDRSAASYARTMLRRQYFGHAGRMSGTRGFRVLGEALALQRGRHPRARTALSLWAHSAPHRAILTGGQFRAIGIGVATGRFQGHQVTMWVARVAR